MYSTEYINQIVEEKVAQQPEKAVLSAIDRLLCKKTCEPHIVAKYNEILQQYIKLKIGFHRFKKNNPDLDSDCSPWVNEIFCMSTHLVRQETYYQQVLKYKLEIRKVKIEKDALKAQMNKKELEITELVEKLFVTDF